MSLIEMAQLMGNLGEFVGALVIFVTLIYLVRQVRQNAKSVSASAYQTWVASNMSLNEVDAELSVTIANAIYDSANLTQDNYMRFAMWNYSFVQMAQATDYLHEMGSIDDELWLAELNRTRGHLALPGVWQWWQAGGRTQFSDDFVHRLEAVESCITRWAWQDERGFVAEQERPG
jgi:hypothetical protein